MNCMENLVSVIVPVYNVETYLEECIKSIVNQTYKNLELILIDDGSTDSSGEQCDSWAEIDNRIKVIHKENGGLSTARNAGLDVAKGEYICFIDSDDFVTENYLESFINAINDSGAQIAFCDITSAKLAEVAHGIENRTVLSAAECRKWLYNPISREYVIMVIACAKMYASSLFKGLRFEVGRYHEDEFLINHILFSIEKAVFIPEGNYIYRNNEESITGKQNENNIYHLHVLDAYEYRINEAMKHDDIEFAQVTTKFALLKTAHFYKAGTEEVKLEAKNVYNRIYDNYASLLTKKQRMKYRVFKQMPNIFCKVFI